jgi:serpin B
MISDVLHKTTITVDEAGTEAAAASAVIVGVRSYNPEDPIVLVIDRPFQFFIMHKPTNAILFMGKVMQP